MKRTAIALAALAALGAAAIVPALADGGEGERIAPVTHQATLQECGACHMAYPAGFLPQASWKAVMGDLENHFGENAMLGEEVRADIEAYLLANAADAGGRRPRALRGVDTANPPLRISELPWFRREHDREVSPRALQKAGSIANCAACHRGAERGYFEDD